MKKQITFLALFLLIIFNSSEAQIQPKIQIQQQWVARYNGPGNGTDQVRLVKVDEAGNVYVAGQSTGVGTDLDYTLIKYNSAGVQQWVQRFGGTANGYDYVTAMLIDGEGNVYITGAAKGPGHDGRNMDVVTIKYNSFGVQQWTRTFNGFNGWDDIPSTMVFDASGNLIIGGTTVYIYEDFLTLKYNSSGDFQWARAYNGEFFGFDYGFAASVDAAGNVYTTGYVETLAGGMDISTVKYNSDGVEQSVLEHTGGTGLANWPVAILIDASGNIIVGGSSNTPETGYDFLAVKYNSSGGHQWLRKYNSPQNGQDVASAMVFDNSGNIILTGKINDYHPQGSNYATVKYNSSGVQQWASTYTGTPTGNDNAWAVTTDALGNVYVTGESFGTGTQSDYATIKYNPAGVQQWVQRYNGPGNSVDVARAVAVDQQGNIYVTGESAGSGTGSDFATIKYSQFSRPIANEITDVFKLSENFPNPFNPTTVISYSLAHSGYASLKIYDVLGNEVATLVDGQQNPGTYSVEWNASNFSSGIYFYKLVTDHFVETKKLNLIK